MRYRTEEIENRLRIGEDSNWEFEQVVFSGNVTKSPTRQEWADEIAAFANARGGILLAGVSDQGKIFGMTREQEMNLDLLLVEVCSDTVKPPIRIHTSHRELSCGRTVLVVEVPQGESVHESDSGKCYIRVGSTKRLMESDERFRLSQHRSMNRYLWFDKQPVPETGGETLVERLWKPLVSIEGKEGPEAELVKQAFLCGERGGDMRATVAGVLLCTPNPERWMPQAVISATRYRGRDRASGQIDAQEITGPLDQQITEAVAFAIRNMQVASRKEPARVDLPQYSDRAIFEAVVNAVVHRDYSIRGERIRLSMFDDRLEILSPGTLPNNLRIEHMVRRLSTRNETLVSNMMRIPVKGTRGSGNRRFFMERRGDGVAIIRRETQALCGKLPEYHLVDGTDLLLVIPAAYLESTNARSVVTVRSKSRPCSGADLLLIHPDGTWKSTSTDEEGEGAVDLHTSHLPMTVFAAAPGHAAHRESQWIPIRRALAIELVPLPKGGSVIFTEAVGRLPGLKGGINPILDRFDRTFLYASNIAINGGREQPVPFFRGEELRLIDAEGSGLMVRIIDVIGQSALIDHIVPASRAPDLGSSTSSGNPP